MVELRDAVKNALGVRPVDISSHLFCTKRGKPYINEETGKASGWISIWQRFMRRVLKETALSERFADHDLRAKAASDADSAVHAQELLAHTSTNITNRV